MSFDPRQLKEDARGTVADGQYVHTLEKKWAPLLEGVPGRTAAEKYTRGVMAVLMENESHHLRNLNEETRQINVGPFTKFVFPVLRRVFPTLIANEIVSVQPMTAPIGAIFYLDYIYGTNKGGTNAGNTFPRDFDKDYSSEYVNGEALVTGDGTNFGGAGTALSASLGFKPVRPLDATKGYSVVIKEISTATGATVQTATDNGTGGFTGDVASGTINYSNGAISGFKFTAAPVSTNAVKVYYYYDSEFNAQLPQVGLDVKKAPVEAVTRKLKALWSAEAAEDLKNLHGIDAETEIISVTAQEIALEIDREIINDLFQASTGTSGTFDRIPPAAISELDHLRGMITTFSTVSNQIHKKTLRAPANFIVTSPEISALLSQLTTHGDFRPLWSGNGPTNGSADAPMPLTQHGQFGIYKVGTLMNKWMIYEDPFFTKDMALVGLKGGSYLDSGYVWAPYIPLQITPTFLDPNDFTFRKGMRTRYAKKLVRSEFYGQVRILNV